MRLSFRPDDHTVLSYWQQPGDERTYGSDIYRLDSALGRWDAEFEYWRQFQARLHAFSSSSREGATLPPLDSFGLTK